MNICFFHSGFSRTGGIERVVSVLLNEFASDKNLKMYSLEYFQLNEKRVYSISANVSFNALFDKPISMTKAILLKGIVKKVRRYIKANDIDIVVACGVLYFPVAILAAKHTKAKTICWEHTNPNVVSDYRFQKICRKIGAKRSNQNVVITEKALDFYNKMSTKNCLIYNPVDDKLFESAPEYNVQSKKIVSVGRLCYAKNYDLMINIAEKILSAHVDWSWDIYGGGEEFERLNKKVETTSVSDRLNFKGNVTDIYDRYKNYSFIVMTSRYEGFPMVLLEASAKALPMVSFDIETGPSEIIRNDWNGFLIENHNVQEMINKINCLIENGDKRVFMSKNAHEFSKKFAIEKKCLQWKNLFEELCL